MNTGHRTSGAASLDILEVDRMRFGLNVDEHRRVRLIQKLHTAPDQRCKGDATWLMCEVCGEADQDGTVLILEPRPNADDAPMDAATLHAWYGRLGFVEIMRDPFILMMREPRSRLH